MNKYFLNISAHGLKNEPILPRLSTSICPRSYHQAQKLEARRPMRNLPADVLQRFSANPGNSGIRFEHKSELVGPDEAVGLDPQKNEFNILEKFHFRESQVGSFGGLQSRLRKERPVPKVLKMFNRVF